MFANVIHVCCTPQQYLLLCEYFDVVPPDLELYKGKVKIGESELYHFYIRVNEWKYSFPANEYACLSTYMTKEEYIKPKSFRIYHQ